MLPTYYVITPTVHRRPPLQFAQYNLLHLYVGFRSVYGFTSDQRDLLLSRQHLRRISHMPVIAQDLLVDFDEQPLQAQVFQEYLQEQGLMFNMYDSGNRSVHFHVACSWMEGTWVPYAQREWARRHAVGCDLTIYRHTGMFRLPYTWHEKRPGHRKQLRLSVSGHLLDIPRAEPPLRLLPTTQLPSDEALDKFKVGLTRFQSLGGRRIHAWYLGAMACDAGLGLDEAVDAVLQWNQTHSYPPLDAAVVITKIEEAYISRTKEGS